MFRTSLRRHALLFGSLISAGALLYLAAMSGQPGGTGRRPAAAEQTTLDSPGRPAAPPTRRTAALPRADVATSDGDAKPLTVPAPADLPGTAEIATMSTNELNETIAELQGDAQGYQELSPGVRVVYDQLVTARQARESMAPLAQRLAGLAVAPPIRSHAGESQP
jgi:hypothetical protein